MGRLLCCLAMMMAIVLGMVQTGLAEVPAPDDPDAVPLWTDRPIKVDPARQNFERLPSTVVIDQHVRGISVPGYVRVSDSASFFIGRTQYVIRHVKPIQAKRYCRHDDGARWGCGRMSAIFLGNLVRGQRMQCDQPDPPKADATGKAERLVVDCTVRGKRIAAEIIRMGFGKADGDATLQSLELEARKSRTGIWTDKSCMSDFETC